ncbi:hypothetical protein [Kineococcus sp. SYSU DK005]|uniref:hypothetical protein n=1 Tax=Kineococcus sp. SYSU DK005 TaxID=3383126 RepID=UPI003D7C5725
MPEPAAGFCELALSRPPVLVVLRGLSREQIVDLTQGARDLGVHLVQVPVHSREWLAALEQLAARTSDRGGVQVGAGTVTTRTRAREAVAAGAAGAAARGGPLGVGGWTSRPGR